MRKTLSPLARRVDERLFPEATSAGDQAQRVVMDRAVDRFLRSLGPAELTCVEISGDTKADRGWKRYLSLNYPAVRHLRPDTTGHLRRRPVRTGPRARDRSVPGRREPASAVRAGRARVVTTPFLIKAHELPMYGMRDYWRFTPRGMRCCSNRPGSGSTRSAPGATALGVVGNLDRWSARRPWHSMGNNREMPVVVGVRPQSAAGIAPTLRSRTRPPPRRRGTS